MDFSAASHYCTPGNQVMAMLSNTIYVWILSTGQYRISLIQQDNSTIVGIYSMRQWIRSKMIPCSPAMYCSTFRSHWAVHFNCQTLFESWQTQSFYDQAYYGTRPFTQRGRVWARAYIQVVSEECSNVWVISDQWRHYTHDHYRAPHCPPQQLLPHTSGAAQWFAISSCWWNWKLGESHFHGIICNLIGQVSIPTRIWMYSACRDPPPHAKVVVLNPFTCLTGLH